MLLIAAAWCLWGASPAAAQAYPCSGPGPGERMIGMTPGGNGIAPVPLCVRDGGGAGAPVTYVDTVASIAWHAEAADVWVEGSYDGPNTAERVALQACNEAMGGGCSSIGEWKNSSMAILRDRQGYFYSAWLGDGGATRKKVMADCSAKQLLPCEQFGKYGAGTRRRWPGAGVRKAFAAGAWVTASDAYDGKLYVAGGAATADAATAAALKACADATRQECNVTALSGNGIIQTYRMNGGDDTATVETSAKRARAAAELYCKQKKAESCVMQRQFDARTPGLFVHDFAAPRP